jgi:hypothetical protein
VTEPQLQRFLDGFERALHATGRRERRRALREAHDHVLCSAAERQSDGVGRADAVADAIASFGPVDAIAASYRAPRSRTNIATVSGLVLAVALAALSFAPGSIIPTSHAADSTCPLRWNAHPFSSPFRLAWVSASGSGCDVVLHAGSRARVFHQDTRTDTWHVSTRPFASLSAHQRTREYVLGGDGRIERLSAARS